MSDPLQSPAESAEERARALLNDTAHPEQTRNLRLTGAVADLFRPDGYRLSDLERTTMQQMLDRLVTSTEDNFRAVLLQDPDLPESPEFSAALGSDRIAIAKPILERTQLLAKPKLVAALLRRSDEYQLVKALRKTALGIENSTLNDLIEDSNPEIARGAMAVLIAESRRNDRFDEPVFQIGDLQEDVRNKLVWAIAAAVREYGVREHGLEPASLDRGLANAGQQMLATIHIDSSLPHIASELAEKLDSGGLLHDTLLVEALGSARPILYVSLLAARSDVAFELAWELVTGGDIGPHATILRLANIGREAAAHLMMTIADATGGAHEQVTDWVEIYDDLTPQAAMSMIRPWQFDDHYGEAILALSVALSGATS